jgi:CRP-like cAMP-binding protein
MALLDDDDPTLFPKLTDEQLDLLKQHGYIRQTTVGEVLFREGDATYDVMVLLEGRVAIVLGSGDVARDITIHRPRDIMIELNILTGHRVHANGVVREAGSVLVVPAEEFRALLGRELVFGNFILQMLFRRRRAIERLRSGIQIIGSRFDRNTHRLREFGRAIASCTTGSMSTSPARRGCWISSRSTSRGAGRFARGRHVSPRSHPRRTSEGDRCCPWFRV